MSSQVQPIGTFPSAYRLISPIVTVDATGGIVLVSGNSKFNTNLPLDKYALITQVTWLVSMQQMSVAVGSTDRSIWNYIGQLTEALARTTPASTDPVFVDNYFDEIEWNYFQATVASYTPNQFTNRTKAQWVHVLANPWATAAQQLNLVCSVGPPAGHNPTDNGQKLNFQAILEYQLLPLTPDVRSYLATRVQIAGQA